MLSVTVTKKQLQAEAKVRGEKKFLWSGQEHYTSNGQNVAVAAKYEAMPQRIAARARYAQTPQGKANCAKGAAKYKQSLHGKEAAAKYRRDNAEKISAQSARYYRANVEKMTEYGARYYRGNVEKYAAQHAKYYARLRATALAILGGRCKWTGETTGLQVDHIIPRSRRQRTGYESDGCALNFWIVKNPVEARERLQLLCADANMFKGRRNNDEARADWMTKHGQVSLPLAA